MSSHPAQGKISDSLITFATNCAAHLHVVALQWNERIQGGHTTMNVVLAVSLYGLENTRGVLIGRR